MSGAIPNKCHDCGSHETGPNPLADTVRMGGTVRVCRDRGACLARRRQVSAKIYRRMRARGQPELPGMGL